MMPININAYIDETFHNQGETSLEAKGPNILRPTQNGWHFADDIFRGIFVNENDILMKITLKIIPGAPIGSKSLVQVMAWHWTSCKP